MAFCQAAGKNPGSDNDGGRAFCIDAGRAAITGIALRKPFSIELCLEVVGSWVGLLLASNPIVGAAPERPGSAALTLPAVLAGGKWVGDSIGGAVGSALWSVVCSDTGIDGEFIRSESTVAVCVPDKDWERGNAFLIESGKEWCRERAISKGNDCVCIPRCCFACDSVSSVRCTHELSKRLPMLVNKSASEFLEARIYVGGLSS